MYWLCFIYVSIFSFVSDLNLFTVYLLVAIVYSNYDRKKNQKKTIYTVWWDTPPTPPSFGWNTASTPYSLTGYTTSPIIGCLQEVHNIIRTGRCVFCPTGGQTEAFAVWCCYTNHWATEIWPLRPSYKTTNVISTYDVSPYQHFSSLKPCYTFFAPNFYLPNSKFLHWPQAISFPLPNW